MSSFSEVANLRSFVLEAWCRSSQQTKPQRAIGMLTPRYVRQPTGARRHFDRTLGRDAAGSVFLGLCPVRLEEQDHHVGA